MESRELAIQAAIALDKKKAANIKVIKVRDLTVLTDYFVIANGTSTTHVAALADEVEFQLAKNCSEKPSQRLQALDPVGLQQCDRECVYPRYP